MLPMVPLMFDLMLRARDSLPQKGISELMTPPRNPVFTQRMVPISVPSQLPKYLLLPVLEFISLMVDTE
jgi:hypothetical protein